MNDNNKINYHVNAHGCYAFSPAIVRKNKKKGYLKAILISIFISLYIIAVPTEVSAKHTIKLHQCG